MVKHNVGGISSKYGNFGNSKSANSAAFTNQPADFGHVSLPLSHAAMQLERRQFLLKYSEKYLSIAKPKYIAVT